MTGTQMIDLYVLLAGKPMPRPLVVHRLNYAANRLLALIRRDYLPALDANDTGAQDSEGKVGLPADIWERHNGIDMIRPQGSSLIAHRLISWQEYRRLIETGAVLAVDSMRPKYSIRGEYACILPISSGSAVDIYYRKAPTAIADNTTANTDFSARLQDILIRVALMGINDGLYKSAIEEIRELNNTRPMTESNDVIDAGSIDMGSMQGYFPFQGLGTVRDATAVTEDGGTIVEVG